MTQFLDSIFNFWSSKESEIDFSDFLDEEEKNESPKLSLKTGLFLSAAAVAVAGTLLYTFRFGKKKDEGLAPAVSEEVAREVMREILTKIKMAVSNFLRQVEGIKQQLAASGQEVGEQELLKHVVTPQLDSAYRQAQDAVLTAHGIEEGDLEEAVNKYIAGGDKELTSIADTMRNIYRSLGGDLGDDDEQEAASAEVSLEDLLSILRVTMLRSKEALEEMASEIRRMGAAPRPDMMQAAVMELMERAEKESIEEAGVSLNSFHAAIKKYQHLPQVQELYAMLQMQLSTTMMSLGNGV